MLDSQTKQRINNARQILVGVAPTPQAQIDQITTALIYKFMDDMDRENEEIGRQATFLVDELAEFAWGKLMSKKLSGEARWQVYTKATESFAKSKQIPAFFRTIFKDAYLPYRDGRVLNLFLTEINGFSYEHSEKLGDAFEYLLSISGAQADAGQFRTPRHLINFITHIVNPQKNERILDPACGTAGFLISAYQHILKHNSKEFNPDKTPDFSNNSQNNGYKGDQLTPDERQTLANNIHGYDIAPEMVRLSLVNLYLHGFISPQISNYDTLTYDTNWNDDYDVILANPPFMTPKGGILPHNRFSVRANRAEVLFVDYIAEHLSIKGRAGIIVPEGIIFQVANAYKSLRKNLIENWGLYCVISLPAGVFQPYSGVKTSVLLLDKALAKKSAELLFINIENDGFDLGAKRHKIDKNDLPQAYQTIKNWQQNQTIADNDKTLALSVAKSKIAKDGDYNLSANRYIEVVDYSHAKWDIVALGEVCEIKRGQSITKKQIKEGSIPVIAGGQQPAYFHNIANRNGYTITVSGSGAYAGFINFFNVPIFASDCSTIKEKNKNISIKFIYWMLKVQQEKIYTLRSGMAQPHVYPKDLQKIKIPLPPLEVQQQIVAEIESYQKVIDGAKQVVANYKLTIKINPDWPMVALGEVCNIYNGSTPKRTEDKYWENGQIPWFTVDDIREQGRVITRTKQKITQEGLNKSSVKLLPKNTTLLCCTASIGEYAITKIELTTNQQFNGLVIKEKFKPRLEAKFLFLFSSIFKSELIKLSGKSTFNFISVKMVKTIKIPLPPLEVQQQIVEEIESEQKAVDECKKLITSQEQKIKTKIDGVWS